MSRKRADESILLHEASMGQLLNALQTRWEKEFYRSQSNNTWLPIIVTLIEQNRLDDIKDALPTLKNILENAR